jgi:PIN domain nuclease of toxin-antitoxin system
VRLLLDTHALLWVLTDARQLAEDARRAILGTSSVVAVSPVSGWELETKRALGKLETPTDLVEQVDRLRFVPTPITLEHAIAAGRLPLHHRDPFDRMLVAQAQLEDYVIVTRDSRIALYDVEVMPA